MPSVKTKGRPKRRPAKPCKGGCGKRTRTESGYCAACGPATKKEVKKAVRGSVGSTRKGRSLREQCLRRDLFRCTFPGCSYSEPAEVALGGGSKLHADHHVPKVRGGSDELSNLRTLCATHNLKKGSRPPAPPSRTPGIGLGEVRAKCARCRKNPVRFPGARCAECLPTALASSTTYARKSKGRR